MTRTSMFGTIRPDLGTIIKFDTPGQNETQLDEDKFEEVISKHFEKHSALSYKRIAFMSGRIIGSGVVQDYILGLNRADDLLELMVSKNPNKYQQVNRGYVRLTEK